MIYSLIIFSFVSQAICENYVHTFAQEWPGSICRAENCQDAFMGNYDGLRWNMHGLWPNLKMDGYCLSLHECKADVFDPRLLSSRTQLEVDVGWVGLYSDSDWFRKHEFEKHGTCVPNTNEDQFFELVMMLSHKFNVFDALKSHGIVPRDDVKYEMTDIKRAIQLYLKNDDVDVHMSCVKDIHGNFHIGQVKFCLDNQFMPGSCLCSHSHVEELSSELISCPNQMFYPTMLNQEKV